MYISKIELTAFKSYQYQTFEFPKPTAGKNIVLIGGMNGFGKTSILEALYLCLFGKDAMSHLARAGLKTDEKAGYPTFLERAFNGEARRDGSDTMTVRVVISQSASTSYEITRKWFFRSNGSWSDEETTVRTITRGIPDHPKADGKDNFYLVDLLDEIFMPAHIAPFFFFDGEEVKKLADQSRLEQVKQGLEGLLGVVLLRALNQRMKNFESSRRDGVSTVDENQLEKIFSELNLAENEASSLQRNISSLQDQRQELDEVFESLMERLSSAGGGGANTATFKDLIEQREQLRNVLRLSRDSLDSIIADKLPFQMVSKDVRSNLRGQLVAEGKYFRWENEKATLEPRKQEFLSAMNSISEPIFQPSLTDEQEQTLSERLSSAWASLFFPPPNDCAEQIIHSYLTQNERETLLRFMDALGLSASDISSQISKQAELNSKIDDLSRKISKLEGIENDGTLQTLRNELEDVRNRINDLDEKRSEAERRLVAVESNLNTLRATYEREKKKLDDSSPARALIQKSERVRLVVDELVPALFPLKVKSLAVAMTKVYKQLAHKEQVSRIQIEQDGRTQIIGKSGKPISFDRSAGENQIFATALIAGLAEVSKVKAPLVVDTPLGRLDSKHRANILKFWTDDKNRQVILLSQDQEISAEMRKSIQSSVAVTYLLEHLDVGDGIGRTTAKANSYFGAEQ
jgi:DNA sulfur modification protein DndD